MGRWGDRRNRRAQRAQEGQKGWGDRQGWWGGEMGGERRQKGGQLMG